MVRPFGLLLVFLLTLALAAFAQGQSTPSGVGQATPEAAAKPPRRFARTTQHEGNRDRERRP